ncbi:MAG: DUF3137 domain-containing protein [Thermoanaerobaculia bacterium]
MGFLRKVFGPSREEVWRQLCQEIGADFVEGGFWKGDKVQARVEDWIVTLDTYTVHAGKAHVEFTRLRAPFVSRDGFRFVVYRRSFFSDLGKKLGMQDIEAGHSLHFDEDFILQGNDESKVRALFANPEIRRLLGEQPEIRLEIKDRDRSFRNILPENVDELHVQIHGFIKDVGRLKRLFDLFAEVLDELSRMGSASEADPGVRL